VSLPRGKEENDRKEKQIASNKHEIEFPRDIAESNRSRLAENDRDCIRYEECHRHSIRSNFCEKDLCRICV
jgi:hypothetical protein